MAWGTAYFALLAYVYVFRLQRWDYLGFWYGGTDSFRLGYCLVLSLLPLVWMDTRVQRFSTFVHWIIYFFIYVPAVLIPVLQGLTDDVLALAFSIFVSFSVITLFPKLPTVGATTRIGKRQFWRAFWIFYALLFVYVLYIFRNNLSLPSFYDVYGQRSSASDVATGTFVGYATGMLSGCLNPFLMAVGLRHRHRGLFLAGLVGQVAMFATFALKSVLVSVPVLALFYWMLWRPRTVRIGRLGAMVCISITVPLVVTELVDVSASVLMQNVVALVFMRTYGMVGALTGIYNDFFANNELTHFSHINVVRLFIDYPYTLSIGEVIGEHLGFDMNSNANFFATDGIAGAGKTGVLIVGCVVGALLSCIDRVVPRENHRLLCIASASVAMSLANTSVFTTLLTGGLILLVLLAYVWRDSYLPGSASQRLPGRHFRHRTHAPV